MNRFDLPVLKYAQLLSEALLATANDEAERIVAAGQLVADTVAAGGVVHTFGSGHSALVAAEPVGRSGSLAPLNQIVDKTEDLAERLPGYGHILAEFYGQQYGLRSGETLLVVSNSGINPLGIELAQAAQERGLKVVAITNLSQSRRQVSRHPSGLRLFEVADVALDNHAPPGEALLELPGLVERVASVGTITGAYLVNALLAVAVQELIARGVQPPVIVSENTEDGSAEARNSALRLYYQGRLRRAGV